VNKRQAEFVRQYLIDFNATRAARDSGYSHRSARAIGQENLTKPDIKAAIEEKIADRNEVLSGLTEISRCSMANLVALEDDVARIQLTVEDPVTHEIKLNPNVKFIKKLKQKVTRIIPKNKFEDTQEIVETNIELYSKHDALRDLGKYHGLFIDKTDLTTNGKDLPAAVVNVYIPANGRESS